MNGFGLDLRHAVRLYRGTPISSGLALLSLAAAMACVSAFLSLWSDLSLKPHPGFAQSGTLLTLAQTDSSSFAATSLRLIEAIDEGATSVDAVAGIATIGQHVVTDDQLEAVTTELVSRGYSGLRPNLALGRHFEAADHQAGAEPVTILSHRFWQQHLGGRSDVIGETVGIRAPDRTFGPAPAGDESVPTRNYRIVGVYGPAMTGTFGTETALWMPFEQTTAMWPGAEIFQRSPMLQGVVRPTRGTGPEMVRTELNARFADAEAGLAMSPGHRLEVSSGVVGSIPVRRDAERQVFLFLAGSALLVLVAVTNVCLFLLSRAPARRRELAIRLAIGAPAKRLAAQLVGEVGLLVFTATVLGLLMSVWLSAFLQELPFLRLARWRDVTAADWRVVTMLSGVMLLAGALVSLAPILGLRNLQLERSARTVTAQAGWGQRLVGTAQIALAGTLAATAVGFAWHLVHLVNADHGFEAEDVHVISLAAEESLAPIDEDEARLILLERERMREIIETLPSINAVAFGSAVPGRLALREALTFPRPESDGDAITVPVVSADAAYPSVLRMTVADGRALGSTDLDGVLVNETLAQPLWGRTNVAGELLAFPGLGGSDSLRVIGVLRDAAYEHPSADPRPLVFRLVGLSSRWDSILVRSPLTSAEIQSLLQLSIDGGALEMDLASVEPLQVVWSASFAADRARTLLTMGSAVIVVVLAAFGFYGTQSYLVLTGRREYAIRAALGASPPALRRLVLLRAVTMSFPGLVLASLLSYLVVMWLRADFLSMAVRPAMVTLIVGVTIVALVALASFGPARQARSVAPARVLRED